MAGVSLAEINEKFEHILELLQDIRRCDATRDEQIKQLIETAQHNKEAINGNGKPGLKTEVETLKQKVAAVYWFGGIILVAVIGDTMTRILTAAAR